MSSKYNFLDSLIKTGRIKLIFSEDLLDEFLDVTNRPKFLKYFEKFEIDKLFKIINKYAIFIDVRSDVILSRDNNDDFLLNLALDSNADYLVSGDSDLLVLDKIGNTKIITINKLKEYLMIIN